MTRPTAKSKKRAEAQKADEDALAAFEKKVASNVVKQDAVKKPRLGVPTNEIVNIMSAEIQAIYEEMGSKIDDLNARDKSLVLWRDLAVHGHVTAQDRKVPHVLCEEHK